jgi:hypothetical protein
MAFFSEFRKENTYFCILIVPDWEKIYEKLLKPVFKRLKAGEAIVTTDHIHFIILKFNVDSPSNIH